MWRGHRTRLKINLCVVPLRCPLPPYIKEGRRRPAKKGRANERGVLLGFGPTLFSFYRRGKRGRRGE